MNSLTKAIHRSTGISEMTRTHTIEQSKGDFGGVMASAGDVGGFSSMMDNRGARHRYDLFRGWLFSAINAIAEKGAGQGVNVARIINAEEDKSSKLTNSKQYLLNKMTKRAHSKVSKSHISGVEILESSPILDVLEQPNDIQDRWQFVYSFIANLAITGWSYILIDTNDEGKLEFFSIPTTWVTPLPDSKGRPFGKFKIRNPRRGDVEGEDFDRNQVAFAYLPNPSDPLAALSPALAQINAVRIDDKIQASQNVFFDNGIFPSVIVTVGHNPHPEVTPGIRPRLTNAQRRQVFGMINRTMRGVTNYGNPAIVDGYIEKVSRFSFDSNEMGWDKSEDKVRSRILSAYAVHPYMLGEPVGVGGYAQVAGIERVFCAKVNTYLDMLGNVLSNKLINITDDDKLLVWWDKCEPLDPNIRNKMLMEGRKNNDVTRNEFRSELGFPPMDEGSDRSRLVGDQVAMSSLLNALGNHNLLNSDTLAQLLMLFLGVTEEEARNIAGTSSDEVIPAQELVDELQRIAIELKKPIQVDVNDDAVQKQVNDIMKKLDEN